MTNPTARSQHIGFCKTRALEYVDQGYLQMALDSLASDLSKHPATHDHDAITLMTMLRTGGHLRTAKDVRDFIDGIS